MQQDMPQLFTKSCNEGTSFYFQSEPFQYQPKITPTATVKAILVAAAAAASAAVLME
jgi:hypothetical protein